MGTSLSTKTPGSPDNSFNWLLHNNGDSLATGFSVTLGNGTESQLVLSSTGIGIRSTGGRHDLTSAATAVRAWTLADASGTLYPESVLATPTDSVNSTVTPVAVSALDFTPLSGGRYEFEALLIVRSAATGTGIVLQLGAPAEVAFSGWVSRGPSNTEASEVVKYGSGSPARYDGVNMPVINTDYLVALRGIYTVTGTPSAAIRLQVNSEVAASTVTLKANSFIRHRKIN